MQRTIIFFLITGLFFACSTKPKEKSVEVAPKRNDLPAMPITLMNGQTIEAKALQGNVVLVLFQPDCDHCQHEAQDIEQRLSEFKDYTLYFVTSNPQPEAERFASDYKLKDRDHVIFGLTPAQSVLNNFGPIQAPSIYIYSDGRLKKSINGQTDVSEIIQSL